MIYSADADCAGGRNAGRVMPWRPKPVVECAVVIAVHVAMSSYHHKSSLDRYDSYCAGLDGGDGPVSWRCGVVVVLMEALLVGRMDESKHGLDWWGFYWRLRIFGWR